MIHPVCVRDHVRMERKIGGALAIDCKNPPLPVGRLERTDAGSIFQGNIYQCPTCHAEVFVDTGKSQPFSQGRLADLIGQASMSLHELYVTWFVKKGP